MAEEKKYRCKANILTKGKNKDFFAGQLVSEGEFKQLPAKIKKKFELVTVMALMSGSGEEMANAMVEQQTKMAGLEDELDQKNKQIDEMQKKLAGIDEEEPKEDPKADV